MWAARDGYLRSDNRLAPILLTAATVMPVALGVLLDPTSWVPAPSLMAAEVDATLQFYLRPIE